MTGAIMEMQYRKEEKALSHYHARVHYFERGKVKVTFVARMSFLHGKSHVMSPRKSNAWLGKVFFAIVKETIEG